jgi:hypothetical protein
MVQDTLGEDQVDALSGDRQFQDIALEKIARIPMFMETFRGDLHGGGDIYAQVVMVMEVIPKEQEAGKTGAAPGVQNDLPFTGKPCRELLPISTTIAFEKPMAGGLLDHF